MYRAASNSIEPPRAGTIPEIARLRVDLPAPFEPRTATMSPAFDHEIDAAQDFDFAVTGT